MANHTTVSWHDHGKRTLFSIQVPKLPQRLIAMNYTKIAIMGGAGGCGVNQQLHHHMMVMTIVVFQSNHQFILSAKLKLMMKIHHATTMDCQKWEGIIYPMYLSSSTCVALQQFQAHHQISQHPTVCSVGAASVFQVPTPLP